MRDDDAVAFGRFVPQQQQQQQRCVLFIQSMDAPKSLLTLRRHTTHASSSWMRRRTHRAPASGAARPAARFTCDALYFENAPGRISALSPGALDARLNRTIGEEASLHNSVVPPAAA